MRQRHGESATGPHRIAPGLLDDDARDRSATGPGEPRGRRPERSRRPRAGASARPDPGRPRDLGTAPPPRARGAGRARAGVRCARSPVRAGRGAPRGGARTSREARDRTLRPRRAGRRVGEAVAEHLDLEGEQLDLGPHPTDLVEVAEGTGEHGLVQDLQDAFVAAQQLARDARPARAAASRSGSARSSGSASRTSSSRLSAASRSSRRSCSVTSCPSREAAMRTAAHRPGRAADAVGHAATPSTRPTAWTTSPPRPSCALLGAPRPSSPTAPGSPGVGVGTWLLRQDELVLAVLIWVVTFGVGTVPDRRRHARPRVGRAHRPHRQARRRRRGAPTRPGARREDRGDDWRHRSPVLTETATEDRAEDRE